MRRLPDIAVLAAAALLVAAGAAAAQTGEGPAEAKKAVDAPSQAAPKDQAAKPSGKDARTAPAPAAGQPPVDDGKAKGDAKDATAGKDGAAPAKPVPPRKKSPEEEELDRNLEDVQKTINEFQVRSEEYRKEIQLIVERKFEERRTLLKSQYERAIKDLEVDQRKRRADAIARFEEFVRKYPSDPKYSPDAMFRLSELYFERSTEEYLEAKEDFDRQMREFEEGKIKVEPTEPTKRLEKVVGIYQQIINDFPDYKLIDAVHYLLGYALQEQGEYKEAKEIFASLIRKYPKSKFLVESWVRIGEYYFDQADPPDLDGALDAYRQAMADKKHPLYDKALYKLAWAYYRKDDLVNAVKYFADLVDFYETSGKKDDKTGAMMRPEAIRYIAISFADEHNENGGVEKAKQFFKTRGSPKYQKEVIQEIGDVMYDSAGSVIDGKSNFLNAIDAYKYVLALDPFDPKAPKLQEKIIDAYARGERNPEAAAAERAVLVATYGPKSPWFEKNKNDPEAIQAAQELTEKALYTAAIFHHQQAQSMKQAGKAEEMLQQYKAAADAYGRYLAMFPHSKNAYELQYFYADSLFFSNQFEKAALQYEKVRDSPAGDKYAADSMLSAVVAWEKEIEVQTKAKKLPELKIWTSKDVKLKKGEQITAKPIAEIRRKYITDSEIMLKRFIDHENAPKVAYSVALIYYQHFDLGESRKRFTEIIDRWPKMDIAKDSANLIIETYLVYEDWEKVAEWTDKFQQGKFGDEKMAKEWGKLEAGAMFNHAKKLFDDKKYEEAAAEYIRLVNKKPDNEFADKALNNAALAYQNTRKFDAAAKIYDRIYTEYPKSTLADYALFKVATNKESAFQYDVAIEKYLYLVENYPQSEHRVASLWNAAMALENLQDYPKAAANFQRFAQYYPDHDRASDALWRVILIYEKMKDYNAAIKACDAFNKKFGKDPKQSGRTVETLVKVAEAYTEMKNQKAAMKAYEDVLKEFQKRSLSTKTRAAYFAAKAKYLQAEPIFAKYDALKLGSNAKNLKKELEAKAKMNIEVTKAYEAVIPYKQAEWTLAALYRIGYAKQRFAETLFEAPVPPQLKSDEEKAMYQDELAKLAEPIEEAALQLYRNAAKVATELKVVNEWTKKTLESLNKMRSSEYPLQKDAKGAFQDQPFPESTIDLLDPKVRPVVPKPAPVVEPPPTAPAPAPAAGPGKPGAAPAAAPGQPGKPGAAPAAGQAPPPAAQPQAPGAPAKPSEAGQPPAQGQPPPKGAQEKVQDEGK